MARNIGQDVIENVWCAVPGYPEQLEIVRQIKNSERSVYATLTSTTRSIDRLMEFRAALITAAVTGQIDVATWGKRGGTDRRLDDIESNMAAARAAGTAAGGAGMMESPKKYAATSAHKEVVLEQPRKAIPELKKQGFSNRKIAKLTGVSHTTVANDLAGNMLPKTGNDLSPPRRLSPRRL